MTPICRPASGQRETGHDVVWAGGAGFAPTPGLAVLSGETVQPEIKRREMLAQIDALSATIKAAEATADAARYSQVSAKWMKWSVVMAAISIALNAITSLVSLGL